MSLIKCPECQREISDKSKICIHCGYPIEEDLNECCTINNVTFNLTKYKNALQDGTSSIDELEYELFQEVRSITIYESKELIKIINDTHKIPNTFNSHHVSALLPRCPHCGSTSITTGARGVNWMLGLIGASKTVNRCANCGHMWKPRR